MRHKYSPRKLLFIYLLRNDAGGAGLALVLPIMDANHGLSALRGVDGEC